jgi:hypothetical protein
MPLEEKEISLCLGSASSRAEFEIQMVKSHWDE